MEEGRVEVFSKPVRNLWNNWDVRVFVLCSLLVQILLIFLVTLRKRTASKPLIIFTWSLYLLADWLAVFALGLLSNSVGDTSDTTGGNSKPGVKIMASSGGPKHNVEKSSNNNALAFWAPFLLLHLGGPDTITAFAMEDNELWLRHLLGVMFEVGLAGYVFLLSVPKNKLLAPTLFMFVAGIIKYGERTYALYLASMDGFRDSMLEKLGPGTNYAKLMEEHQSKKEAGIPAQIVNSTKPEAHDIEMQQQEMDELTRMYKAHRFFKNFKGLIIDLMASFHDQVESRNTFLRWFPEDAFRVVEYELEFIYDVLFTKAAVVHNIVGYILRAICSCSIMTAFLLFFCTNKRDFLPLDIAITYTLLGGAIALDFVAFIMLLISNWSAVKIPMLGPIVFKIIANLLPHDRWSVSIMQYNLIDTCIPQHDQYLRRIANRHTLCGKFFEASYIQKALAVLPCKMLGNLMKEMQYTYHVAVSEDMKNIIFHELKKKTEIMKQPKAVRGQWALEQRGYLSQFGDSIQVEFDESLLRWHIATTICYYTNEDVGKTPPTNNNSKNKGPNDLNQENEAVNQENEAVPISTTIHRRLSKLISDYMIYLLVMQPSMMSSSAVIRFLETSAEARKFFLRKPFRENPYLASPIFCSSQYSEEEREKERQSACEDLLSVNTVADPIEVKGDWSKSVLFDACILAKKLKDKVKVTQRWALICEVWVEMLSYAACNCSGIAHAQRLSKGGELLTFVWFLMSHLIDPGPGRAKLIVGK
ncbi:uncharacterized protein LOC131221860 [Magnolia sinica]|uniref:uncharacterized protein LOC131221860 n=1 Tax=Magnolia sinica TaxID=86752 RepID=UPI00265A23AD|nr:uncharacterized protein LOC131221860 [Magnolia sinica]